MIIVADKNVVADTLLHLKVGDRLRLVGENLKYYVFYIGLISDCSVLVTTPERKGKTIFVTGGKSVQVHAIIDGHLYRWSSIVMESYSQPSPHLHLSYPFSLERAELRGAQRVTALIPVEVQLASGDSVFCHIVDISSSGIRLMAPVVLGHVGDVCTTIIKFSPLGASEQRFSCVIRNLRSSENSTGHDLAYCHGVEFQYADDAQRQMVLDLVGLLYGFALTCHLT